MRIYIVTLIIRFVDFFYKLKIKYFLKKKNKIFNVILDIGAHHGESIIFFLKNFNVRKIYSFEPSSINFKILEKILKIFIKRPSIRI